MQPKGVAKAFECHGAVLKILPFPVEQYWGRVCP